MAYIIIIAFLLAMSFIYFPIIGFFSRPDPDFRYYFENPYSFAFFSLVFIPAITMRLWSEERKQGTMELLLTLPIRTWEVVLAKFLAAFAIVLITILLTLPVPLSISLVLHLDWGAIFTTYLGIILISTVYIALGTCASALTENQIVAFMLAIVGSAVICFIGRPEVIKWFDENLWDMGTLFGFLGTFFHFQDFSKGLINPLGLIYCFAFTTIFLIINNIIVEARKY
jgi:ABC-2 type transport system permease protein